MIKPPTASDVPDKHVGAPPLPHLTGENTNKRPVRTAIPLIAPIALLILGCMFTSAPFFQPTGLKRDWAVTVPVVILGIVLLLISITFFAEWSKQRKESSG